MAGLPDADKGGLSVPGLDPGRADSTRPGVIPRSCETGRHARNPGMAVVLLQEPDDGGRPLPGARSVHPANEAQEHAAPFERRGIDHPPWTGVLRLRDW